MKMEIYKCFFCEYDYGPHSKKETPCGSCTRYSKFQPKKRMNHRMASEYAIYCVLEKANVCPNCGSTQCDNITAENIMDLHVMESINYFCGCLSCGTIFIPKEYRNKIWDKKMKKKE